VRRWNSWKIVRQIRADVADRAQLAAALDEIRRTMPPLTGVVHAAGDLHAEDDAPDPGRL
jgi:NAD(P)-dependent dehydrogenase (short-subunit alcohol dehydrogenase family)